MPAKNPTPAELPSDDQVLAAIVRAECHKRHQRPGEMLSIVKEHLDLPHNSWTTKQLRPMLQRLETAGLVYLIRRRGLRLWKATSKGKERVTANRSRIVLPESPQHRRWREASATAVARIPTLRAQLRGVLSDTLDLLAASDADSAVWTGADERLRDACQALASTTYCATEWPEPDDARADIAPTRKQAALRGVRSWA